MIAHQLIGGLKKAALIHKSIMMRQKDYPYGSSSFILEDNIPSTMLCKKLSISINKEFHLYEIQGDDNFSFICIT